MGCSSALNKSPVPPTPKFTPPSHLGKMSSKHSKNGCRQHQSMHCRSRPLRPFPSLTRPSRDPGGTARSQSRHIPPSHSTFRPDARGISTGALPIEDSLAAVHHQATDLEPQSSFSSWRAFRSSCWLTLPPASDRKRQMRSGHCRSLSARRHVSHESQQTHLVELRTRRTVAWTVDVVMVTEHPSARSVSKSVGDADECGATLLAIWAHGLAVPLSWVAALCCSHPIPIS